MGEGIRAKILICVDCKEEFAFTASAQEYFAEKGYTEDPKRCRTCYAEYKRKQRRNGETRVRTNGLPVDDEFEEPAFKFPDSDVMESGNGDRSENE